MMTWSLLIDIVVGWLTGPAFGELLKLLRFLLLGSTVSIAVVLALGCNAPATTPASSASGPITVTTGSAPPVQQLAGATFPADSGLGLLAAQHASSRSPLPLMGDLSANDLIGCLLLSGGCGAAAGGVVAATVARRSSRSNGQ
jgi:hypothetical protein